jgi:hypothetical protein
MTKKQMNMMEKIISKHINGAWEDGAREERQNVVAWLRAQSQLTLYEATPDDVADAIERGDHVKEVTDGPA